MDRLKTSLTVHTVVYGQPPFWNLSLCFNTDYRNWVCKYRGAIPSDNLKGLKYRSTIRCASWNLPRLTRLILMGMFAYTCLHITGQIDDTDHYLSKKKKSVLYLGGKACSKKIEGKKKEFPLAPSLEKAENSLNFREVFCLSPST